MLNKARNSSRLAFVFGLILIFSLYIWQYAISSNVYATPDSGLTNNQNTPHSPTPTSSQTKQISAKALTNHECDNTEWHFIINQVSDMNHAPASIHVVWSNGQSADVNRNDFNGGVAHYTTTLNLNSTVTSATANIYSDWDGQFNLSHGPCNTPSNSPTPTTPLDPTLTPTPGPSNAPRPSDTPGPSNAPQPSNTPGPSNAPQPTNTPGPSNAPRPTDTPIPGPTNTPQPGPTNTPGPGPTSTPGPEKKTGQVLGASTLAATGSFEDSALNMLFVAGAVLFALSVKKYVREQKA